MTAKTLVAAMMLLLCAAAPTVSSYKRINQRARCQNSGSIYDRDRSFVELTESRTVELSSFRGKPFC